MGSSWFLLQWPNHTVAIDLDVEFFLNFSCRWLIFDMENIFHTLLIEVQSNGTNSTSDNIYINWYLDNPTGLTVFLQLLCLLYMFVAMSAISVYFLCPTMTDICKNYLNLNESVAGVTLMAFANGSNDFFSCASAFMSNQGSLALSELIGAGIFLTTFAIGYIIFNSDIERLPSRPFMRDVSFLSIFYLSIYVILKDGAIYWYESVFLLIMYIIYVCVVLIGRKIYEKNRPNSSAALTSTDSDLERDQLIPAEDQHNLTDESGLLIKSDEKRFWSINSYDTSHPETNEADSLVDESSLAASSVNEPELLGGWLTILIPILAPWRKMSLVRKVYTIIELPYYLICSVTIPSYQSMDEIGDRLNVDGYLLDRLVQLKYLWHLFFIPISFPLLTLPYAFVERNSIWFAISGLGLSAVGLILNMIYRRFTVSYFIGPSLLLSIAWTYYLAKQLVLLMAAFSIIFQISDVMLGSLLFAFGNSIGDLIANLTMAKLGQPRLAIFACFGNPMINLSFGISVSTLFYMVAHKSPFYLLESSVSLSAFMVSAVVIYFLFGISSFLLKWKVPKWLGLCMSIAYLVGLALHVAIELKS